VSVECEMNHAYLRFYAELNDFMPVTQQHTLIDHPFELSRSIKDMIESLGVPHTEIDLILVNGNSVGFDYQVRDGDRVSVYPRFTSIDITPLLRVRPQPLPVARFVLDTHLGKLAAYLRMLGFDTLYRNDYTDAELAHISHAEERILLTKDRGLLKRTEVTHGYFVREIDPQQQVAEVLRRFALSQSVAPFSRCLRCNTLLKPVDKATIVDRLPPKTREYYQEFRICPTCGRIYWRGSHYDRMQHLIDRLLQSEAEQPRLDQPRPHPQDAGATNQSTDHASHRKEMPMRSNNTLQKLKAGQAALGAGLVFGSPLIAELLSQAGFDFVLVDMQHGLWDDQQAMDAFRAICLANATPMLRVQQNDYYTIGRALDRGALGVVIPLVNSAEEARAAAYAVRYPPRGGRSMGPTGTGFLGDDYTKAINEELFVAVQIESQVAVEHAREILAVDGVDGCWIGPSDLALSMGVDLTTPQGKSAHEAAILSVRDACHATGKIPGIAGTPETAQHWLDEGFLFVTVVSDFGLIKGANAVLQQLHPPS
jgi:2-keto-3-deoxy-L-rhamnonate aldolase RhmA/uncharacterized protein with PIN domain